MSKIPVSPIVLIAVAVAVVGVGCARSLPTRQEGRALNRRVDLFPIR